MGSRDFERLPCPNCGLELLWSQLDWHRVCTHPWSMPRVCTSCNHDCGTPKKLLEHQIQRHDYQAWAPGLERVTCPRCQAQMQQRCFADHQRLHQSRDESIALWNRNISYQGTPSASNSSDPVGKIRCPECNHPVHPHSLARHRRDTHALSDEDKEEEPEVSLKDYFSRDGKECRKDEYLPTGRERERRLGLAWVGRGL